MKTKIIKIIDIFLLIFLVSVLMNLSVPKQTLLAQVIPQPNGGDSVPTGEKPPTVSKIEAEIDSFIVRPPGDNKHYGYYYANGKWVRQRVDINSGQYSGQAEKISDMNEIEGKKHYLEVIKSHYPNGYAWLEYTDSGGKKKVENTAIDKDKFSVDDRGKLIIKSTSTASPAPVGSPMITSTPGGGTEGKYVSKYFGTGSFPEYLQKLYEWTVGAGILLAVIMLMLAGYTYAISAGDVEKINNAKERIVGALLGLLVLILAAMILSNLGVAN